MTTATEPTFADTLKGKSQDELLSMLGEIQSVLADLIDDEAPAQLAEIIKANAATSSFADKVQSVTFETMGFDNGHFFEVYNAELVWHDGTKVRVDFDDDNELEQLLTELTGQALHELGQLDCSSTVTINLTESSIVYSNEH